MRARGELEHGRTQHTDSFRDAVVKAFAERPESRRSRTSPTSGASGAWLRGDGIRNRLMRRS